MSLTLILHSLQYPFFLLLTLFTLFKVKPLTRTLYLSTATVSYSEIAVDLKTRLDETAEYHCLTVVSLKEQG